MAFTRQPRWLLILISLTLGLAISEPLSAQNRNAKFREGDRVEVESLGEWKPGTVLKAGNADGWINVRLDDDGKFDSMPQEAREQFLTRSLPPDQVRAVPGRGSKRKAASARAPLRTWTDRSGKFRIEARYERLNDTKVALLKSDGKRVEVPLDRLSDADADYIRTLDGDSANPFQEVADESAGDAPAPAASKADWTSVKTIRPQTFAKWAFVAPTADRKAAAPASMATEAIELAEIPDSQAFFEDIHGVYVAPDGSRAIVPREQGKVAQEKQQYVEDLDLVAGKSRGLVPLPPKTKLLDANAEGGLVMYRPDIFGHGTNTVLIVSKLDDGVLSPVATWEPYAHEDWEPRRDIHQAWFLGPERVLTINEHGKALTVWDVASAKALLNLPVGSAFNLRIAHSPDRRILAVIMEKGVALIDLSSERHVATIPLDGPEFYEVKFSEDSRYLAGISEAGLTLWNLATGEEVANFYHPALGRRGGLAWAGEFVLVDNQYLFDPKRRVLLWEYQNAPGGDLISDLRGGRLWAVSRPDRSGAMTFISTALPHAGAIEEAASLPSAEELLVVRPGDTVSLEVDVDPNIAMPDDIRKSLTASLEAAGLKVADGSKLVLNAICKQQPTQTIRINVDNRWPVRIERDIEERTITPHASYLELSLAGEPLWNRGYVATPGHVIYMNRDENLDQALERLTKPNLALFENTKFSPYVARPGKATESGAYGASQVTAQGMVDAGSGGQGGVFQ